MATFWQLFSFVGGLIGLVLVVVVPPLGVLILIFSALVFVRAVRSKRNAVEERRHRELLEAVKAGKTEL